MEYRVRYCLDTGCRDGRTWNVQMGYSLDMRCREKVKTRYSPFLDSMPSLQPMSNQLPICTGHVQCVPNLYIPYAANTQIYSQVPVRTLSVQPMTILYLIPTAPVQIVPRLYSPCPVSTTSLLPMSCMYAISKAHIIHTVPSM